MFGGNLGGPIAKKISLYGFVGAEFLRESTPATRVATLPTAAERSGDFGASAGLETATGFNIRSFQRVRPTPYMQQFSSDVQMEVGKNMLLEAGFAGTEGRKLAYGFNGFYEGLNVNQLTDEALRIGAPLNEQVPNRFFGII
jgi:hypothetical protein